MKILMIDLGNIIPSKPLKLLYVHTKEDNSYQEYKILFESSIIENFVFEDFVIDEEEIPWTTYLNLSNYVFYNEFDIVIGHGLGAYFVAGLSKVIKILVNPILNHIQTKDPKRYTQYNNDLWVNYGRLSEKDVFLYIGDRDKKLGCNSYNLIDKLYIYSNCKIYKTILKNQSHVLDNEAIKNIINDLVNYIDIKGEQI